MKKRGWGVKVTLEWLVGKQRKEPFEIAPKWKVEASREKFWKTQFPGKEMNCCKEKDVFGVFQQQKGRWQGRGLWTQGPRSKMSAERRQAASFQYDEKPSRFQAWDGCDLICKDPSGYSRASEIWRHKSRNRKWRPFQESRQVRLVSWFRVLVRKWSKAGRFKISFKDRGHSTC